MKFPLELWGKSAEIDAILGQAREQAEQIAQTSRAQGEAEAAAILERMDAAQISRF